MTINSSPKNLLRFFALSFSLVTFAVVGYGQSAAFNVQPNIVYILCDDLGFGDVHALNPERCKIATPNMDRLRVEGMAFSDCHSSSAVCTPSRYSILTGRYNWRSRLQSGVLGGEGEPLISPARLTVGEFLKRHGYMTAALGKWHLGLRFDKRDFAKPISDGPQQHGFDYFFGISASLDMPPYAYIENDHFTEIPSATKEFPSFMYGTNAVPGPHRLGPAVPGFEAVDVLPKITSKAVDYISKRGADKKPFFLYVPLPSPHTPVVPTKEWQGKSSIGPYGDYVMETDWSLGQMVKAVDAAGLRDNTLIIFTSDNDLLHVKLPDNAGEDSVSLLPALLGIDKQPLHEAIVSHSNTGRFAIRKGDWKLELCPGSGGWGQPGDAAAIKEGLPSIQLYNMRDDVSEKANVEGKNAEVVANLLNLLRQYVADGRSTPGARQTNDVSVDIWKKQLNDSKKAKVANRRKAVGD